MFKRIVCDTETNGLIDMVTDLWTICIGDIDSGEVLKFDVLQGNLTDAFKYLLEAEQIIGFNSIDYDLPVLIKLYPELQILETRTSIDHNLDLLLAARLMYPDVKGQDFVRVRNGFPAALIGKHSLEAWGYRIGEKKGEFKKEDTSAERWAVCTQEMIDYCAQDVKVTMALYHKLKPMEYAREAMQIEHDVRRYISWQERSGVPFDVSKARELYVSVKHDYEMKWREVSSLFPDHVQEKVWTPKVNNTSRGYKKGVQITQTKTVPFNVGSRQQLIDYFKTKYNWVPVDFTENGAPEMSAAVLESMPYSEAKIIAELFDMKKLMGSLYDGPTGWLKLTKNGRLHGRVITNGAISGRAAHFSPNLGNIPSVSAYKGKECRALFNSGHDKDYTLVGCDIAALELRIFAHYLAKWDNGNYAKIVLHGDVHTENMKAFGVDTRATAKTLIFSVLFGCGAAKAGLTAKPEAGEEEAKMIGRKIIGNFKTSVPAYRELLEGVYNTLDTRGYLIGLDGRKLIPRSKHAGLNVLIQGAGAVVMKKAICIFYEKAKELDYYPVCWVHDELLTVVKKEQAEILAKMQADSIKEAGEYFKLNVPMGSAWKIGSTWADVH